MTICEFYPETGKLLECERETLQFLKDNATIQKKFPSLASHANVYYFKTKNGLRKSTFFFESIFDVKIKGRDGYAYISSEIKKKDETGLEKTSYNLAIYAQNSITARMKILRKFHFDYAPPGTALRQPHPVFHLQYAGKLSKMLKEMNLDAGHLDVDIDGPRLCYFPISLALLIHFILMEFPSEKNRELMELAKWRTLVRKNEGLILEPFFKNCHRFFSNKSENKLFLSDFYYGN